MLYYVLIIFAPLIFDITIAIGLGKSQNLGDIYRKYIPFACHRQEKECPKVRF